MNDFHPLITDWYRLNHRTLPWRETKNAYFIWLSEVILQQTRVNQGLNYYLKFIKNYPTVVDLASASEQKILNDWQGLGYYSRARNLHQTAKMIVDHHNAIFPNSYEEIKKLKGIGDYTAAAIASFAFGLPHAVVDGNVYRVLSRIFDIDTPIDSLQGKKDFQILAESLLSQENPGIHNQAIMEFGALQCVPKNPICSSCPFYDSCLARRNNSIEQRPIKMGKTKIKKRYFHYIHFDFDNKTILEQRTAKDIWEQLFQFPLIEFEHEMPLDKVKENIEKKFQLTNSTPSAPIKHILSHQHLYATVWKVNHLPIVNLENWFEIEAKQLSDFPIPRLLDRYLQEEW